MNKKDLMYKRNQCARLFEHTSRIHRNCIRFNPHNSWEHEQMKAAICYGLLKEGKEFITEAKLLYNRGIVDIVVLDDFQVIEILHSETEEECKKKCEKYPKELEIRMVKV